jgi:hypothetical protein
MPICDRCHKQTTTTIMSMFNEDIICLHCKELERKQSDYQYACDEEQKEVLKGNYNFKGVGYKP